MVDRLAFCLLLRDYPLIANDLIMRAAAETLRVLLGAVPR